MNYSLHLQLSCKIKEMNNNLDFRFKQFVVSHQKSAMKVGTDGVLLGAWCQVDENTIAWDVGAGCGLISLMLAQRGCSKIYSIEIDCLATEEAKYNSERSKFAKKIIVVNANILSEYKNIPRPDIIVCNPPFYNAQTASPDSMRSLARTESDGLGVHSIIKIASETLHDGGRLFIITPASRANDVEFYSKYYRLYISERIDVSYSANKPAKRILWCISKRNSIPKRSNEYLMENEKTRSSWYSILTNNYYLDKNEE